MIAELAEQGGWERYEVSAYARDGYRAVHNVNYWEYGDYLGIGPGAHSKLSFPDRVIGRPACVIRHVDGRRQGARQQSSSHRPNGKRPISPLNSCLTLCV